MLEVTRLRFLLRIVIFDLISFSLDILDYFISALYLTFSYLTLLLILLLQDSTSWQTEVPTSSMQSP